MRRQPFKLTGGTVKLLSGNIRLSLTSPSPSPIAWSTSPSTTSTLSCGRRRTSSRTAVASGRSRDRPELNRRALPPHHLRRIWAQAPSRNLTRSSTLATLIVRRGSYLWRTSDKICVSLLGSGCGGSMLIYTAYTIDYSDGRLNRSAEDVVHVRACSGQRI